MREPAGLMVGIAVAKTTLDVAVHPAGEERHLTTDAAGIAAVVRWLQTVRPWLTVLEATGG